MVLTEYKIKKTQFAGASSLNGQKNKKILSSSSPKLYSPSTSSFLESPEKLSLKRSPQISASTLQFRKESLFNSPFNSIFHNLTSPSTFSFYSFFNFYLHLHLQPQQAFTFSKSLKIHHIINTIFSA
ncbi:unnamed protein product [Vicia faba]|uniref:Uncharacterized protein n=1 Tax=Vicia faba TaxID=3906 RepID=A0AAV1AIX2_VICFA|nr:unnamed protein product [Vicia faba]